MSPLSSQDAPVRRAIRTGTIGVSCPCGLRVPPHSSHECGPASELGTKVERILLRAQDDVDALAAERDALRVELGRAEAKADDLDRRMDLAREVASRMRPLLRQAVHGQAGADDARRGLHEAIALLAKGCPLDDPALQGER